MSRIGKLPVIIPNKVEVKLNDNILVVKGPKGQLDLKVLSEVKLAIGDNEIIVSVDRPNIKKQRSYWGLYQRLISNMMKGVTDGFERKLQMVGVGYKAQLKGKQLVVDAAFSHQIEIDIPDALTVSIEKDIITISGIDKQQVGEFAANIRKIRKPEPYKGKGIKYVDEVVRRKDGKKASA